MRGSHQIHCVPPRLVVPLAGHHAISQKAAPAFAIQPGATEFIGQVSLHRLPRRGGSRLREAQGTGQRHEECDLPELHGVGAWLPFSASFSTRPKMATPSRIFSGVSVTKLKRSARGSGLAA